MNLWVQGWRSAKRHSLIRRWKCGSGYEEVAMSRSVTIQPREARPTQERLGHLDYTTDRACRARPLSRTRDCALGTCPKRPSLKDAQSLVQTHILFSAACWILFCTNQLTQLAFLSNLTIPEDNCNIYLAHFWNSIPSTVIDRVATGCKLPLPLFYLISEVKSDVSF